MGILLDIDDVNEALKCGVKTIAEYEVWLENKYSNSDKDFEAFPSFSEYVIKKHKEKEQNENK